MRASPLMAVCAAAAAAAAALPIPAPLLADRYDLAAPAVCNDGSAAAYYWRNCTANWDNGPGSPDYCAKGSPAGVATTDWVIHFAQDDQLSTNGGANPPPRPARPTWCWDDATCAARRADAPWLTSSAPLNGSISPGGLMCAGPEVNPNFYKNIVAVVPYCSSDLWVGTGGTAGRFTFAGQTIALAAIDAMLATKGLGAADNVVFVGGPGVMASLPALAARLPKTVRVRAVCDGCVFLGDDQVEPFAPHGVTAQTAVAAGLAHWGVTSVSTEALVWPGLGKALRAGAVPVAAQHPLFDAAQLALLGAPATPTAAAAKYTAAFADRIAAALTSVPFGYGAACSTPTTAFAAEDPYFNTFVPPAPQRGAGLRGFGFNASLDTLSGVFMRGAAPSWHAVDACRTAGCNPSCPP